MSRRHSARSGSTSGMFKTPSPYGRGVRLSAARDRRDDLIFLGVRIERTVVQDVPRADALGDRAALVARLAQDPLSFDHALARLFGQRLGVPLHRLMSASIGNNYAAHA